MTKKDRKTQRTELKAKYPRNVLKNVRSGVCKVVSSDVVRLSVRWRRQTQSIYESKRKSLSNDVHRIRPNPKTPTARLMAKISGRSTPAILNPLLLFPSEVGVEVAEVAEELETA